MSKFSIPCLAACFALGARASPAAEPMKLAAEDLPRIVRERNLDVAGAQRLVEAAEARIGHLRRSYLPTVRAEAGGERFQTGAHETRTEPYGGVEARMNLFRGGKDALEEKVRRARREGAVAGVGKTAASDLLEARGTYWNLVALRESAELVSVALERNEENLKAAEKRIGAGLAAETDRLEFVIYRGQLNEELASITHEMELVQISLTALLGLPIETRFKTADAIAHAHDEDLLAATYEPDSYPEVRSLRAGQGASENQGLLNGRWWAPTLDLYGGRSLYTLRDRDYRSQALRDDTYGGARLSLALFDYSSKDEARALSKQAEGYGLQAEHKAVLLRAQVERAKEEMKHLHELIHNGEERIEQGKKYLAAVRDEYRRGVKNSLDVLGASQRYLSFERQYADRRRDYQTAKASLLSLLGQ